MANLSIQYQRIGDSIYTDYTTSIKNIHQYGGINLRIYKTMTDSFVTVKIDKYPDVKLCEPTATYEWKPNQWLFMPNDGIYESCMECFDKDAEYFRFDADYFNNSNRFDFVVSPIFNVAGRYCIVVSEYANEDNAIVGSQKIYVEVTDIKTSYLTTPFDGESNEFNGWNKAITKDVYGLLKNVGNNFVMCFYDGDKSFDQMIGSLCCVDAEIYAGYTDNFFKINNEGYDEKNVYGVVTEAFVDHCFIRDNPYDNFVTEVKVCKLAFAGTYSISLSKGEFSGSGYVYFDSTEMKITSDPDRGGKIVGVYDAERQIIQLSQGFTYGDINSITGDIGDMLVMGANGWERLPHGESGEVLTIENISGNSDQYIPYPVWRQTSSIHNMYNQFVSPKFEFKFSINEGDALKFSEIYDNSSICIEESGLKDFFINGGNVYLGEEAVVGNFITTSPDDVLPNLYTEVFNVYEVNGITYFVVDKEDLPPTILPDGLSLIKYSRKGAICTEISEPVYSEEGEFASSDTRANDNFMFFHNKFFSTGDNSSLVWNIYREFLPSDNIDIKYNLPHISMALFDTNTNSLRGSKYILDNSFQQCSDFDFYGMNGLKGILAVTYKDTNSKYKVRLCTNIKNDFENYKDFNANYIDINICDTAFEIPLGIKIIKHKNFYSLYFLKIYINNTTQSPVSYSVGCISFIVTYSAEEEQSNINVISTTFTNSFSYEKEIGELNATNVTQFYYISPINDTNDVIIIPTIDGTGKQQWKMLISSEVNALGEMSITYFNDFDASIFHLDSTNIKGMSITKVKDNICAIALNAIAEDDHSNSLCFNYIKLLVYNESFDELSSEIKKSLEIIETEDYNSGYNMNRLCSPIMDKYQAHYDTNGTEIQKLPYHQFIKIINVGRDSFAVFYTAKDNDSSDSSVYLRCAIGTVNIRIDEVGQKHFDVFWQEIRNYITTIEDDEFCSESIVKCNNVKGDETVLIDVQSIKEGSESGDKMYLQNRIFTLKFSPIYENNIMGIAGDRIGTKRFICYAGEVDINDSDIDFESLSIGQNLYCDDFGNLTDVPTENYIGQYIGINRIVKK